MPDDKLDLDHYIQQASSDLYEMRQGRYLENAPKFTTETVGEVYTLTSNNQDK